MSTCPPGPLTVLYIMGAPRSGSTLLDIVLGAHPDVVSVGELSRLPEAVPGGNRFCACGEHGSRCPFWHEILELWTEYLNRDPMASLAKHQRMFTRPIRFRPIPPGLTYGEGQPSQELRAFRAELASLYRAIAVVSGARVIVDSSKIPARAVALTQIPEIDLRVVHLVRDGRGVAWSLMTPFSKDARAGVRRDIHAKSILRSSWRWRRVNSVSDQVLANAGSRGIRVRYEDFVANPRETLRGIYRLVGLDLDDAAEALEHGEGFAPGHLIAGNRLRMQSAVRLSRDKRWRREMPRRSRWLFWAVAGRVARRYGYTSE